MAFQLITQFLLSPEIIGASIRAKNLREAGRQVQEVSEMNAEIFELNAQLAGISAEDARDRGDEQAGAIYKQSRIVRGKQRAALAGGALDVDFGSLAEIQSQTKLSFELDMLTVKNNAWRESFGFEIEGISQRSNANITRTRGIIDRLSAETQADTALIGGGLKLFERYMNTAVSLATAGAGGGGASKSGFGSFSKSVGKASRSDIFESGSATGGFGGANRRF